MNLKDCKSTGEVQSYIITEILKPLNKDIQAYNKKLTKALDHAADINENYYFASQIERITSQIISLATALDKPGYR